MKLGTIPPGLAGKTVKNRPLPETIRLQDLANSAHSQTKKKIILDIAAQWKLKQEISRVYFFHSYFGDTVKWTRPNFHLLDWLDQKELNFCYPTGPESHTYQKKWSPKLGRKKRGRGLEKSTGYSVAVPIMPLGRHLLNERERKQ